MGSAASDALAPSPTFWVTSGHRCSAFTIHKPLVTLIVLMNLGTPWVFLFI